MEIVRFYNSVLYHFKTFFKHLFVGIIDLNFRKESESIIARKVAKISPVRNQAAQGRLENSDLLCRSQKS